MTDPIADFLARIRNAILARQAEVLAPASKLKQRLCVVLKDEGYKLAGNAPIYAILREAKDRLGESELRVGRFYYQQAKYYPAAIQRLNALLKDDPEFSRRDAAYFYLGESLMKIKRPAEALPYYEKLVKEFEKSEFLDEAQKRIAELKAQAEAKTQ